MWAKSELREAQKWAPPLPNSLISFFTSSLYIGRPRALIPRALLPRIWGLCPQQDLLEYSLFTLAQAAIFMIPLDQLGDLRFSLQISMILRLPVWFAHSSKPGRFLRTWTQNHTLVPRKYRDSQQNRSLKRALSSCSHLSHACPQVWKNKKMK